MSTTSGHWAGDRAYLGWRSPQGKCQVLVRDQAGLRPLDHIKLHSIGFEWGYAGGQGPTDLALSLLADALGEDAGAVRPDHGRAYDLRHAAATALTSRLPRSGWWVVQRHDLISWVREIENEPAASCRPIPFRSSRALPSARPPSIADGGPYVLSVSSS